MTTLTRIPINPQTRGGRRLLTNPQAMHAAVRACFPPDIDEDVARVLWRTDLDEHACTLYIVGPEEPDRRVIIDQAGWPTRPGETADYRPFLDALKRGQEWAFRLVANPVRSLPTNGAKRGKVVPHVTPAQQVEWLVGKADAAGFTIRDRDGESGSEGPDVLVDRRQDLAFARRDPSDEHRRTVTLRTARFEGSLRVEDVEALRRTLTQGLGKGRAYGCGLLTLARRGR